MTNDYETKYLVFNLEGPSSSGRTVIWRVEAKGGGPMALCPGTRRGVATATRLPRERSTRRRASATWHKFCERETRSHKARRTVK